MEGPCRHIMSDSSSAAQGIWNLQWLIPHVGFFNGFLNAKKWLKWIKTMEKPSKTMVGQCLFNGKPQFVHGFCHAKLFFLMIFEIVQNNLAGMVWK